MHAGIELRRPYMISSSETQVHVLVSIYILCEFSSVVYVWQWIVQFGPMCRTGIHVFSKEEIWPSPYTVGHLPIMMDFFLYCNQC